MKNIKKLKLQIQFFREGKYYIAHSPALDLSTCGKDFDEAKKRFEEAVEIFFKELIKRGTLEEVLLQDLGWQKSLTYC